MVDYNRNMFSKDNPGENGKEYKPLLAVTMGDPCGIGPEILWKALLSPEVNAVCRPVAVGNREAFRRAALLPGMPQGEICVCSSLEQACFCPGRVNLIETSEGEMPPPWGNITATGGKMAYQAIEKAIALAMEGSVEGCVTTPIHKESLRAAEVPYIGHTEIFAALTGAKRPQTVFCLKDTPVFFLTRHMSLRQACDAITRERVEEGIRDALGTLADWGYSHPVLAVAGLNPHCGEHGLFGKEETEAILPAVENLAREGLPVVGPIGADAVFFQAFAGKYTGVLSLYHDQGHIACKTVDFYRTVSVTAGLPILRTSVDHGTAFDIAGKGIASEIGLKEAIFAAVSILRKKRR